MVVLVVVELVTVVLLVIAPFDMSVEFDTVVAEALVVELSVVSAGLQAVTLAAAMTASEAKTRVRTRVMLDVSRCEREKVNCREAYDAAMSSDGARSQSRRRR
jgi:hypothetical protein